MSQTRVMHTTLRRRCGLVLALVAGCGVVSGGLPLKQAIGWQADDASLSAEKVRDAIDRGINFLKREQSENGTWRTSGYHRGGVTALATLALLNAGVPPEDLTIKRSLQYLDNLDLDVSTIYTVSLMTMVYAQAGPKTRLARIRQCVEHLAAGQYPVGGRGRGRGEHWEGGWTYSLAAKKIVRIDLDPNLEKAWIQERKSGTVSDAVDFNAVL